MKLCWSLLIVAVALPMIISAKSAESDFWDEDDKEVLVRTARGAKAGSNSGSSSSSSNAPSCRYNKGQWSECDPKTNERTRTLTFKKGDKSCQQTKTVTKKCKKACRYEKGAWTSCTNNVMMRVDNLKPNSDSATCEKTRTHTKGCKSESSAKKNAKERSNKKSNKQQ